MLSNDMHLNLGIPNIWYEADLKADEFHVAGVSIPGVPFIIAGHNDYFAWGITALYGDTQDIYVETLNNRDEYQTADGWRPIEHDRESIARPRRKECRRGCAPHRAWPDPQPHACQ